MTRYRSQIVISLLLVMTTLAVYAQVRNHEFINYDDEDYVTENRHVQAGWNMESLTWAFTTRLHRHWHPLTWLSHMTDCQFHGLDPGRHHLTSVLLHIASTLLLFFVLGRMTGARLRSAFVAALFALHPLHVEPVAWVADRKDVLSGFFWMLTMGAYVRYAERPGFMRYLVVMIAIVLGLMAKPMVVTLPFVLLLLDYWPLKRFESGHSFSHDEPGDSKDPDARYRASPALHLVWEKALLVLIIGASALATVSVMHGAGNASLSELWPRKRHLLNSLVFYVNYIRKMLWPSDLATPYPDLHMAHVWQAGGAGLLLACISCLVFWQGRRRPYLLVGWLWYLITLLPVIGLVRVGPHIMADRYTYIPLIGLFIIIAWGAPEVVTRWRYRRIALAVSTCIVVLGFTICSWFHVRHWKDSIRLFERTVSVTANNELAHNNLGVALSEEGRLEEAIYHFSHALAIQPDYVRAHVNLGFALERQGRVKEAVDYYLKALSIKPDYAEAHNKLGILLAGQGRVEEAIGHFSEALKVEPHDTRAYNNLGNLLAGQGRVKEAIGHYFEALRINPDYAEAHNNLGVALAGQGRVEEAIGHFSEALRIEPDYAEVHNNLGVALAGQGRVKEASGHFYEAFRIKPDYTAAENNLKRSLQILGKSSSGSGTMVGD